MTQGVVKAVIAIAEVGIQGEDRLTGIAVETLAELRTPSVYETNISGDGYSISDTIIRITTSVTGYVGRTS
jgi:hypothetical protein